jgi:electron transport complex protein RnfE
MSTQTYRQITHNGLWKNNPALVQLLGLCPLLAVTASVVNALGLAAATLFVLVTSNFCAYYRCRGDWDRTADASLRV